MSFAKAFIFLIVSHNWFNSLTKYKAYDVSSRKMQTKVVFSKHIRENRIPSFTHKATENFKIISLYFLNGKISEAF